MSRTPLLAAACWPTRRPRRPAARSPARCHALALAAATALLASPAAQALDIFTGNAPVFMGSWFNGSFTEVHEFQFALDWQGWCNAHIGALCTSHRYWGAAGNWSNGVVPGLNADVRVNAGDTVRVGVFSSNYLGNVGGSRLVGSLTATGRVELYSTLSVVNATFADLHNDRDNQGTLITTGLSTVNLLSSGAGRFQGVGGTTVVQAFTPSPALGLFEPLIGPGHTFRYIGNSLAAQMAHHRHASAVGPFAPLNAATPATVAIRLEPTARFVNAGTLDLGNGSVGLQGTATLAQLPTVINTGTLQGNGTVSGVRFDNQGDVLLGAGQAMALANWGEHTGRFLGGAGSTLSFTGLGSAGHRFLAGSQVNSLGEVNFGVGNHLVQGDFSANRVNYNAGGSLGFEGSRPKIGSMVLGEGAVGLRNATGAEIGELTINGNFSSVAVVSGASVDLQRLRLMLGSFHANAPVTIANNVEWSHGFLLGTQAITVTGDWQLLPGTRVLRTNVSNSGNVAWTGGNFSEWSGRLTVQQGKQFDIAGDFNSAGGTGGKLVNAGTVTKSVGTGRSELAMSFDTLSGTVRSLSGTLALVGGGTHTDATFNTAPGARIELSGGTVFGRGVTVSGRLDVVGGSFELLTDAQYAHAAGNRFDDVSDVRIGSGARLQLAERLKASGSVHNHGRLDIGLWVTDIEGDFNQYGSFTLAPGAWLRVHGQFTNGVPLTLTDNPLYALGTLYNPSTLTLTGAVSLDANQLQNSGTLTLVPGAAGARVFLGGGINSGTLRLDGAGNSVSQAGAFVNTGHIASEGVWSTGTSFLQSAGARMDNNGRLEVLGDLGLQAGSVLNNAGSVVATGGSPPSPFDPLGTPSRVIIDAGASLAGAGSFTQAGGLTVVNGLLRADTGVFIDGGTLQGAGTVEGFVVVGPAGQWKPGNSPGTMTVLGDAYLSGSLEIEVASSTLHDRLVVRDSFITFDGAAISFVIDPAYAPRDPDSDRIPWLSASSTHIAGGVNLSFSGLPNQWSGALSPDGRQLVLNNDLAVQIPLSGTVAVPAAGVQFNALGSSSGGYPLLDRLDNAGFFHNRVGAVAGVWGVLNNESGATLVNRGDLSADTLNNAGSFQNRSGSNASVLTLNNSGHVINEGAVQTYRGFSNAAGAVFEQRGEMDANVLVTNDGRLVVAGRLSGPYGYNGSGDVVIEAGGSFEGTAGGWFWASGGNVRVDGLLAAGDIRFFGNNNGRLSGTGRLQGNVESFADIDPGNTVGQLTVDGNLDSRGNLNLEIESASAFDRLVVTGNATLGSATMYLLGSYRPVLGDSFDFLSVAGMLQIGNPLNWVVLRLLDPEDPASGWTPWANPDGIYDANVPADWRAEFDQGTLSITAVPEPGTWALWLAGLVAVARIVRRRDVVPGLRSG